LIDHGNRTTSRTSESGRSWFISGLGIAQICGWGTLYYSFPMIATAMEKDLGWDKTALYGTATLGAVVAGLLAIPIGHAIDRGFGRYIMAGASVISGVLLYIWSVTDDLLVFYLAAAGVGALQASTLYEAAFAVVARRGGPENARAGITALTLWGGFASTIFVPIVQLLLDWCGWRGALQIMAAINIVVCGSIYLLVIDPRRDFGFAATTAPSSPQSHLREAMRNPVFWLLALSLTAYSGAMAALLLHLYPMLIERGLSEFAVVAAMSLIGPAQVGGRVVMMLHGKSVSIRRLGSIVVLGVLIAMIVFAWAPRAVLIICAAAVLYGASNGIMTVVRGTVVPEMLSKKAYGVVNGAIIVPMTMARAFSPLGAAALWASSGNYDVPMMGIVLLSLLMVLAFWAAAAVSSQRSSVV
jgi:predicted MFS family arabinose efflux permease